MPPDAATARAPLYDRWALWAGLALVAAASWGWLLYQDWAMRHMDIADMAMPSLGPWTADDLVLVLDGLVAVETGGTELTQLGPGSVLGERAGLEGSRRTATIRALTDCRIVQYHAADLLADDLRQLASGHHREDQPGSAP